MRSKFIGRRQELEIIHNFLSADQRQIALIYGRRRIGKTKLIEYALGSRPSLVFEGLENEPQRSQIYNFIFQFEQQTGEVVKNRSEITTWSQALILLRSYLQSHPGTVTVLDELQWMANRRSRMVAELKMVWEQYLSKIDGAKLILSGSVASFMVKKVLKSKAFYGRIDTIINLKPLQLREVREFFVGTDAHNAELAYLFVGGVPKYLEVLAAHQSVVRGIAQECFSESGYFKGEFDRIFVSHFGKTAKYKDIVTALHGRYFGLSRGELTKQGISLGGGQLSDELYDLEQAGFVHCFVPFDKKANSKHRRYLVSDNFLSFYLSFMDPLRKGHPGTADSFIATTFVSPQFITWLGHAFELLVLQHADRIAELLGFSGIRYNAGPYFRHHRGGTIKGVQLDLVFDRADKIYTVCEAKYLNASIPLAVGRELNQKIDQIEEFKEKTVQRVLISNQPASPDLLGSGLISRSIQVGEL